MDLSFDLLEPAVCRDQADPITEEFLEGDLKPWLYLPCECWMLLLGLSIPAWFLGKSLW